MKKVAPFLILTAGILWGSMGFFVRALNKEGLVSMDIVALRAITTTMILLFFLFFLKKELLKIHLRDIWCFLGTGICSIVFFNFCYFRCIELTTLSVAAVLLYTAPVFVMIISYFLFQEAITLRKIIALFLTFAGCMLVTGVIGTGSRITLAGILMGLGAGLGYALYSVFSRLALKKGYHSLTITFYTFLIAAIASILLIDSKKLVGIMNFNPGLCILAVIFGLLGTVVPYLVYTLGLSHMENGKASILASIEPVTATILGVAFFHEKMTLMGAAGVVMVLAAIVISQEKEKNAKDRKQEGGV